MSEEKKAVDKGQDPLVATIEDQEKIIDQVLTTFESKAVPGFERALVIRIGATLDLPTRKHSFSVGDSVAINKDSVFNYLNFKGKIGEIKVMDVDDKIGWALVDFEGNQKPLRYGNPDFDKGACDLVLIKEVEPKKYMHDSMVSLCYEHGRVIDHIHTLGLKLKVGDTVLVNHENRHIVTKIENAQSIGAKALVNVVHADGRLEVSIDGLSRIVEQNPEWANTVLSQGDEVLVDPSYSVAFAVLKKKNRKVSDSSSGKLGLNDVIGLEDAKQAIRDYFREWKNRELYQSAIEGTKHVSLQSKGFLLVGPPGNGKTVLVKAIAKEEGAIVLSLPSTEALQKYVGDGPALIRSIASEANRLSNETGKVAIIFVDEIDAIGRVRSSDGQNEYLNSLTNALLTSMDGVDQRGNVLWIGATNRGDLLDEALTRPGRLDQVFYIGRPQPDDVPKFFKLFLEGVKLADSSLEEFVTFAAGEYLSQQLVVAGIQFSGITVPTEVIFAHVGSGATIENIVKTALRTAVRRDADKGNKAFSGILRDDLHHAVLESFNSVKSTNIDNALKEFLKNHNDKTVISINYVS